MNNRNILSVGIAALTMAVFSSLSTPAVAQSMNGSWEVTGGTLHGTPIPANVAFTMTLQVAGNTFVAESGNLSSSGSVTANPQADPQQVTFKIDNGTDLGRELRGIFRFEGQTMTVVFSESDQYPSTFESSAENKYLMLNYQISTGRNNNGGIAQRTKRQITTPPPTVPPKADSGNSSAAAF